MHDVCVWGGEGEGIDEEERALGIAEGARPGANGAGPPPAPAAIESERSRERREQSAPASSSRTVR